MKPWHPTDEQMLCRDLRHMWVPRGAWKDGRNFVRQLRCTRCETLKVQTLDCDGYVLTTRMRYAYGYLRKGGGGITSDTRAYFRVLNLGSLGIHPSEPEEGSTP